MVALLQILGQSLASFGRREVGDINRVYRCRRSPRILGGVERVLHAVDAIGDVSFGGGDARRREGGCA